MWHRRHLFQIAPMNSHPATPSPVRPPNRERIAPGQVARVEKGGRLPIPAEVMREMPWWTRSTIRMMADLVEEGIIRLYPADRVREQLRELIRNAQDEPEEMAGELLAAIADRYRELPLYQDYRITLQKEVCTFLGFQLGERASLFVQPREGFLEVMSLQKRHERLEQYREETTLRPPPLSPRSPSRQRTEK